MIYKLDKDDIWRYLIKFGKTQYGKTIFFICYSLPFVLFLNMIITLILDLVYPNEGFIFIASIIAFVALLTFSVGSYAFYKEFRIFVNKKNQ